MKFNYHILLSKTISTYLDIYPIEDLLKGTKLSKINRLVRKLIDVMDLDDLVEFIFLLKHHLQKHSEKLASEFVDLIIKDVRKIGYDYVLDVEVYMD